MGHEVQRTEVAVMARIHYPATQADEEAFSLYEGEIVWKRTIIGNCIAENGSLFGRRF